MVGDPKQSRPISPINIDYSVIEWVMKRSRRDILHISHRLSDRLSGLVNEFASYEGLESAPEIAPRRLIVDSRISDGEYESVVIFVFVKKL